MIASYRLFIALSLCIVPLASGANELALKTATAAPSEGVAPSIQAELGSKAIQLVGEDGPVYEVVLRKSVPLKGAPKDKKSAMDQIAQGTLLGIMVIHDDERDYRDDDIEAGTYTMRFALQPQDGDHLGTAEYPYFALLIPAEADGDLDGLKGYDAVTEASQEDTATEHPVIISLRPGDQAEAAPVEIREPAEEHKSLALTVPAATPDGKTIVLSFELVYEGMGEM
jgi:hypothetical protein